MASCTLSLFVQNPAEPNGPASTSASWGSLRGDLTPHPWGWSPDGATQPSTVGVAQITGSSDTGHRSFEFAAE